MANIDGPCNYKNGSLYCQVGLIFWPGFGLPSIGYTVKILKIGTPEIITIIVLQLEQLDFTVQYCVQKMPTE